MDQSGPRQRRGWVSLLPGMCPTAAIIHDMWHWLRTAGIHRGRVNIKTAPHQYPLWRWNGHETVIYFYCEFISWLDVLISNQPQGVREESHLTEYWGWNQSFFPQICVVCTPIFFYSNVQLRCSLVPIITSKPTGFWWPEAVSNNKMGYVGPWKMTKRQN